MSDAAENRDLERMRPVFEDQTTFKFNFELNPGSAWSLIGLLQLTTRHPGLPPYMKDLAKQVGRHIQSALILAHPDVADILEKGWHSAYDVKKTAPHPDREDWDSSYQFPDEMMPNEE